MTLEDALNGLLLYWSTHPDGGNRAQLISLAINAGFEEPLLNEWLDVFLQGFVDVGYIAAPGYDANLAPKVQQVGVAVASRAARAVFDYLTKKGAELDVIRKQNQVMFIDDKVVALDSQMTLLQTGITNVTGGPPFGGKQAILAAASDVMGRLQAQRATLLAVKAGIEEELAG